MKCGLRNNLEATAKSIKTGELMDHTLNSTANLGSVLDMDSLQEFEQSKIVHKSNAYYSRKRIIF